MNFLEEFKEQVARYIRENTTGYVVTRDDIFVVWYCKTLQNAKAILSTNVVKGLLFELTLNGDKNELYLDCYTKTENKKINLKGE